MDEHASMVSLQRDSAWRVTPKTAPRTSRPDTGRPRHEATNEDDQSAGAELLTDAQLAERWQLSRGTLANQRSQGRGPAYLKIAGRVRYRRSDIETYEQASMVRTRQGAVNATMTPREAIELLFQTTVP